MAEEKLPASGHPKRLAAVAKEQARSAAEVQAATEKVKTELTALAKHLAEASQARDAAAGPDGIHLGRRAVLVALGERIGLSVKRRRRWRG